MKIELWPLSRVKPYPNNPRVNDSAVDAVAASLLEFGFRQPIVVDAEGVIICGHTRWKAAQKLGFEKVPVHVVKDLSPEHIRAYRIADNQTASLAEWNYDLLPIELGELQAANYDLGMIGFSQDELAKLLGDDVHEGIIVLGAGLLRGSLQADDNRVRDCTRWSLLGGIVRELLETSSDDK